MMTNLKNFPKRIGIIVGGTPEERKYALKSAEDIAKALRNLNYSPFQIDFDKNVIKNLQEKKIELGFIVDATFMGTEEEWRIFLDKRDLREILEQMGIPYTGSPREAAELTKNKIASKEIFLKNNLSTPAYQELNFHNPLKEEIEKIAKRLKFPVIVKPRDEGSSIGIAISRSASQLIEAVENLRKQFSHIFVERYIEGREITAPILEIEGKAKALTLIEIEHGAEFYSPQIKLRDFRMGNQGKSSSLFHVPARLKKSLYQQVQEMAVIAHQSVGCRGYSRVDMIIDSQERPWVLEINSLPVLESRDFVAWAARTEGIDYQRLIKEILESALRNLRRKKYNG